MDAFFLLFLQHHYLLIFLQFDLDGILLAFVSALQNYIFLHILNNLIILLLHLLYRKNLHFCYVLFLHNTSLSLIHIFFGFLRILRLFSRNLFLFQIGIHLCFHVLYYIHRFCIMMVLCYILMCFYPLL